MGLSQWSTTPANNANAATNVDWAENQPPSTVNNSARQMMADVAAWYQAAEWMNFGDTPTFVSTTSFSVPGNQTARYANGRRVRTVNTGGTIYGTITGSTFTSVTTVTLTPDTGSLDSGLSEVDVGIINPALHQNFALQKLTLNEPGNGTDTLTINGTGDSAGAHIKLAGNGTTTPNKYLKAQNGVFQIVNSAYTAVCIQVDDAGNLLAVGNITMQSDERFKKDWAALRPDFLEGLAGVEHGSFTRISDDTRNVGVSAQSLQAVLPEAVLTGPDGYLSVAYGNAALVGVIALTQEVLRLRALLEPAK